MKNNLHEQCPICGSNRHKVLKGYEDDFLSKCNECRFVFSHRIPSDDELKAHYETYNREIIVPQITLNRYKEILSDFEPYRTTGHLYDIGCGTGDFLQVAKHTGWSATGCEYTQAAIDKCAEKDIHVDFGAPDKNLYGGGSFDIVTSFEVIEHLSFPQEHVEFASHLLRKGGVFYCTTPNFSAIERKLLRDQTPFIEYPEHLSYFTVTTLKRLCGQHGLELIHAETTGLSPQNLLKVVKKKDRAETGQQGGPTMDESVRNALESPNTLTSILKKSINSVLTGTRSGNALKATFRKV